MPSPTSPRLSWAQVAPMLLLAVVWGLSIPITKLGLQSLPPLTLTALRFAMAVPVLMVFCFRTRLPVNKLPRMAALGVLGIGIGQITQTFGIAGTTASVGTIISATIPVFVVIFAALRLGQSVTARQRIGLLAAFVGIAIVAVGQGSGAEPASHSTIAGAVWMLVSAVSIAFYYVWSVELADELGTGPMAAWSTLFGFLALLPFAAWEASQTAFNLTFEGLAVAAYLGLAVSAAGLFLWIHILRTVPAGIAAGIQYLQPAFGIAAAAYLFGDALTFFYFVGVALILGGLALTMSR